MDYNKPESPVDGEESISPECVGEPQMNTDSAEGSTDAAFTDVRPEREKVVYEHLDVIPDAEEIGELDGSHVYDEETAGALVAMMFARDHAEDENAPVLTEPSKRAPKSTSQRTESAETRQNEDKPTKKSTKIVISIISALAILFVVFFGYLCVGDCFTYTVSGADNEIIITGYYGLNSFVEIPSEIDGVPVGEIGGTAFKGNGIVRHVMIPDSVAVIGSSAFEGCPALERVTLDGNSGLKRIGNRAFAYCKKLTNIDLPDSIGTIEYECFKGCTSLMAVDLPDYLKQIESELFYGCTKLRSVEMPAVPEQIGQYAFAGCTDLQIAFIPKSVEVIAYCAFENCDSLLIYCEDDSIGKSWSAEWNPDGRPVYLDCTYANGGYLTPLLPFEPGEDDPDIPPTDSSDDSFDFIPIDPPDIIPDEPIEEETPADRFEYTESDGEITITKYVGTDTTVVIPGEIDGKPVVRIASCAFDGSEDTNISSVTSVNIPDSVKIIEDEAFLQCYALETVNIGSGVNAMSGMAFTDGGSLIEIRVSDENTSFMSLDGNLYSKDGTVLVLYATAKTDESFIIPEGVSTIARDAFAYSRIKIIEIPSGVISIGENAFSNCYLLTEIIIPESVTQIGEEIFVGCYDINVYCEAESKPEGWSQYWNTGDCPVTWGYQA